MVGVGDGAADRLGVADVAVGADGAAQRVARLGAAPELVDGAGVDVAVDGDRDVGHAVEISARGAPAQHAPRKPGSNSR